MSGRARAATSYAPGINVREQLERTLRPHVPPHALQRAITDALVITVGIAEARYQAGFKAGSESGARRARLETDAVEHPDT